MSSLTDLLISIPGLLLCFAVHEAAHGFVAYRLGDPTAKYQGRLTLNPFAHLDVFGTLCLLFFHVGWGKPVPVNSRYFRNPRRDMALVSLAGPLSNFVLAFLLMGPYFLLAGQTAIVMQVIDEMLGAAVVMSIGLGLFNLIPVPPLDGSKILFSFLPMSALYKIAKYEQYIQFALMFLLITGIIHVPLSGLINLVYRGFAAVWVKIILSTPLRWLVL